LSQKVALDIKRDPVSNITREKKAASVAQVVESLPSKREAPSSNPSSAKKKIITIKKMKVANCPGRLEKSSLGGEAGRHSVFLKN
jgi:hypothetical protein